MADLEWDGPHTLQVDSWATHHPRALGMLYDGKIRVEVTDGSSWWRVEFPAPWVKPAAAKEDQRG